MYDSLLTLYQMNAKFFTSLDVFYKTARDC